MVKTMIDIDLSCILLRLALVEETKIKEYKKHRLADMEHKCLWLCCAKKSCFFILPEDISQVYSTRNVLVKICPDS